MSETGTKFEFMPCHSARKTMAKPPSIFLYDEIASAAHPLLSGNRTYRINIRIKTRKFVGLTSQELMQD